jgi:hypothetical protein
MEVCQIILNSSAEKRTYEGFFGALGEHLCPAKNYVRCFENAFQNQYEIAHRLGNVKLKNVSKRFAYLLPRSRSTGQFRPENTGKNRDNFRPEYCIQF